MAVFVDVDDTLVRFSGNKVIPIPKVIEYVKDLKNKGYVLYLWSRGGAAYAKSIAEKLGIEHCFVYFLDKPEWMIDDQGIEEWKFLKIVHPNQIENSKTD